MSGCGIDSSRKHSAVTSSDNNNYSSDTHLDELTQTDIYSAVLYISLLHP